MNENELADRFSRDVDTLLDEKNQAEKEMVPNEYKKALELARTLNEVDFSGASRIKASLRNQLRGKIGKENKMLNIRKQNTAWKLASVLLLTMLVAVLIGSGTLDAAAKGLTDLVQRIWVGDFTWAVQNTPSDDVSAETKPARTVTVESRGDLWILRTSIGNFGGDALPGHDLEVKQFDAISDAQAIVNYDICQPGYLPAGYELQVVMLTPMDWVFQFYGVGDEGLVVAQAPVGEVPGNEEGHLTSVGIGLLTDKQIESVILNGQTAGWVDGYGLIWETNGMSFSVGDPELSREEIIRIAESLE